MTWSETDITAAAEAAALRYFGRGGKEAGLTTVMWREIAEAALSAVFIDTDDYLDVHPDVRASLVSEDRAPVEYVDEQRIRCGEGPGACDARYSENPNWVLEHATNALSLYRVLAGHDPRPEDPVTVERERMAQALEVVDPGASTAVLALQLQRLGFTLPQRAA